MSIEAFILIETTAGKVPQVTSALQRLDEVKSVDAVTGPYDVIAVVQAEDWTALGLTVTAKLKAIFGISRTVVGTQIK